MEVRRDSARPRAGDGHAGKRLFGGIALSLILALALPAATAMNVSASTAHAVPLAGWTQQAELTAVDGTAGDRYGWAVAVDGNTALVGAYYKNFITGAAYVYTRSGSSWSQQAIITPTDGAANDHFGWAVALHGDTALIASRSHGNGTVYVFVRSGTTWTQQAELTASDGVGGAAFGWSVAYDGTTAVIGAPFQTNNAGTAGAAYVFTRSGATWTQQAEVTASDASNNDYFGWSTAVSGNTFVVGSPNRFHSSGAAYVFTGSGSSWSQQAEVISSNIARQDNFGTAVALSGDTALIGASGRDRYIGAAYIFTRSGNTWTQQAQLTASDGGHADLFGNAVALEGQLALIGAFGHKRNSGAVYVFGGSGATWTQRRELRAKGGTAFDDFGYALALSGETALVGAPLGTGTNGSAYVFVNGAAS